METKKLQPIILITLYRRYHELVKSLENINKLRIEFKICPAIILFWVSPQPSIFPLLQKYLDLGYLDYIIYREQTELDGVNRATTLPELKNLELGLEFIKSKFSGDFYIIGQAVDITVKAGVYSWMDKEIQEKDAILFFWHNGIAMRDCWHTNCFVVKNLDYYPRFYEKYYNDTLEVMWGRYLKDNNLNNSVQSNNRRNDKFDHSHISEGLPKFEGSSIYGVFNIDCQIHGYRNLWFYIKKYVKKVYLWLKS